MEESDEAGRFLVATRDIRKGEVSNIFKESAIIKIKINININTRVVESESRKVGKSLKTGKNRIKSEKSELISY